MMKGLLKNKAMQEKNKGKVLIKIEILLMLVTMLIIEYCLFSSNNLIDSKIANNSKNQIKSILYQNYDYTINSDNKTVTLNRYIGREENVIIPEKIGNCTVTILGNYVNNQQIHGIFENCEFIKNINIPDTIKKIEFNAFSGCKGISKIEIPNSVLEIGEQSFSNCDNLREITLSNAINEIPKYAFADCIALEEIKIPYGVKTIRNGAFEGCYNLDKITIPRSVTTIEEKIVENAVIACYKDSEAYNYARQNSLQYEIIGLEIEKLEIISLPSKLEYNQNEKTMDLSGGIVKIQYKDGNSEKCNMNSNQFIISGFDTSAPGKKQIIINCQEKTITFEIMVKEIDKNILLGDVNSDNYINATDLLLVKRHIVSDNKEKWILTGKYLVAADINGDEIVNATDLLLLKRKITSNI